NHSFIRGTGSGSLSHFIALPSLFHLAKPNLKLSPNPFYFQSLPRLARSIQGRELFKTYHIIMYILSYIVPGNRIAVHKLKKEKRDDVPDSIFPENKKSGTMHMTPCPK